MFFRWHFVILVVTHYVHFPSLLYAYSHGEFQRYTVATAVEQLWKHPRRDADSQYILAPVRYSIPNIHARIPGVPSYTQVSRVDHRYDHILAVVVRLEPSREEINPNTLHL